MANRSVFADIQLLFPGQKATNPVEVFIRQMQGKDRANRRRKDKIAVAFGDLRRTEEVVVLPNKDKRFFEGTELAEAIVNIYNNEYWLISLWSQMLLNAGQSSLGREVVRAIIKHCVFVTAEDLISHNKSIDARFVRGNGLINRVNYYKRVFTWSEIYACIRIPARRRMDQRFDRHRKASVGFALNRMDFSRVAQQLPELNKILGDSSLPGIVAEAREQVENIGGILQTIYMSSLFWIDSAKLRGALREFARSRQ